MSNNYRLLFKFGARAEPSLGKTLAGTHRGIAKLESAGKGLGRSLSSGLNFNKVNAQLAAGGKKLKAAESGLAGIDKAGAKAGKTNAMLARRFEQTQRSLSGYARSLRASNNRLREHTAAAKREKQLQGQLRAEYDRTAKSMRKLGAGRKFGAASASSRLLNQRGGGFGSVKTLAAGLAGATLTKTILDADMAKFRLLTVINNKGVESKETALRLADEKAHQMAKSAESSLAEAYAIQYALNSGGLTSKKARIAAPTVAKVTIATGGMAEQVGEVITGTYNNLAGSLAGTEEEKFKRIGELLTKTQAKYQLRDFGQLGESMKYGSAALAGYNAKLSQGFMLLGRLNSAQLEGSMAGTALTAMLRGLNKAQDKWNINLVRDQNDQLDLIETLRELDDATSWMETDEKNKAFQKVFGDEGMRAVTPLLAGLNEMKKDLKDVESDSKGIIDRNFNAYLKTTTAELKKLTGTLSTSGVKLGSTFLPIINSAIPQITGVVDSMGQWAAANPGVVKGLAAIGVSLLALKAGSALLSPITGLVKGGINLARGKRGQKGLGGAGGGLMGAMAGATPVRVVNWPGGGFGNGMYGSGYGNLGRKGKGGKLSKGLAKIGRKGLLGKAAGMVGRLAVGAGGLLGIGGAMMGTPALATAATPVAAAGTKAAVSGGLLAKAGKFLGKGAGKIGIKAAGKGLLKKIPGLGLLAGIGFGIDRALDGDWMGALGEVASGAVSLVPVAGTLASVAIDAGLAARDIAKESESAESKAEPQPELSAAQPQPELSKYGFGESTLKVDIKQTVNAPGADADSLKTVLRDGRDELKRVIEQVVTEFYRQQQRTGLNNA